jgi:hypothetical protein
MSTTHEEIVERRSKRFVFAGTLAEEIAGIGAVVLSIIGLANRFPELMLPIATIAIGAALLFEGGAITARFSNLLSLARAQVDFRQFGMGMTMEFLSGIVGVALGILALIGIYPLVLTPVAAIVFGAALILGARVSARLNALWSSMTEEREIVREVTREALEAASGVQFLIGLGAITLGILALIGLNPTILTLVAMLSVGFANLLSGTAIMGRVMTTGRRHAAA